MLGGVRPWSLSKDVKDDKDSKDKNRTAEPWLLVLEVLGVLYVLAFRSRLRGRRATAMGTGLAAEPRSVPTLLLGLDILRRIECERLLQSLQNIRGNFGLLEHLESHCACNRALWRKAPVENV